MKNLVYASIAFICLACTEKSILNNSEIKYIKDFPTSFNITGKKLNIELLGASTFFIIDTFLITKNHNMEKFLTVYSLNSFCKINSFIPQGRGANEFLDFTYCDYYLKDSNQINIYFTDINQRAMFSFNLTKSITKETTISTELTTFHTIYFKTKYKKNMPLFSRMYDPVKKSLSYVKHNLQGDTLENYVLFENITDILRNKIGSADKMKPDFTKLAQAMLQFDQINIIDFENQKNISITTSKHFMPLQTNNSKEPIMYYSDLTCTNNYIYALYPKQPITEWGINNKKSEIQIFTWDGNPTCIIHIPEYLLYINIDEANKQLYGFTADEEIYQYDLQKIIQ